MNWSNWNKWDIPLGLNGSIEALTPDFSCMRATKTQTRLHKRAFSQELCTKHKLFKLSKYHTNIIASSECSCAHSGRNIHCYKITDNKFSFLKEGLPGWKQHVHHVLNTSKFGYCLHCTKPRHRRTLTLIVIESVGKILFWKKKNTNSYLKRHLAPYTEGL